MEPPREFGRSSSSRNANRILAVERAAPTLEEAGSTAQDIYTQAQLEAGDFVDLRVNQTQGDPLLVLSFAALPALESSPEFEMTWLAPGPQG